MYTPGKGASSGDRKLNAAKATLNPNATEFVPFALRSHSASISTSGASSKFANSTPFTPGKSILDRSESSISINSDDEAQQYWCHQLPDDITPDFKVMGLDDTQGVNSLPFSSLSLTDINEGSRFSASMGLSPRTLNGNSHAEKLRFSPYGEYVSPTAFQPSLGKQWDMPTVGNDQFLAREGRVGGNLGHDFLGDVSNEQLLLDNPDADPLEFLASQFPGFAAESLAEVYFANAGDINLTIEMLTQLELQVDGGLNQSFNSKALSTPNLRAMEFPVLCFSDGQNNLSKCGGDDPNENGGSTLLTRSNSSVPSRGATDFASAVRKMGSQDSNIWKYERNGSLGPNIGSSRNSQVLASSYNGGPNRDLYGDRNQSRVSAHAPPVWLETGESVGGNATMYSEMREEARDHPRVGNVYFEQARQAYLTGNNALAKELSIKGQVYNMQMKAAHGKTQETMNSDIQSNGRERVIDVHSLHVSEAINVLKRELSVMRNAARSVGQRLLVYICVGRGSRAPAWLPFAVQRYLLEEEGLHFSEHQPGLLGVVVY